MQIEYYVIFQVNRCQKYIYYVRNGYNTVSCLNVRLGLSPNMININQLQKEKQKNSSWGKKR